MPNSTLIGIAVRDGRRATMQEVSDAKITPERGIDGDYHGRGPRQVTVLSADRWGDACSELGVELPWVTRRANLLVESLPFMETTGSQLRIGDVVLEITLETDPCERMEEQQAGLRKALTPAWRGGVCCRVVSGGEIRVGDRVELEAATR